MVVIQEYIENDLKSPRMILQTMTCMVIYQKVLAIQERLFQAFKLQTLLKKVTRFMQLSCSNVSDSSRAINMIYNKDNQVCIFIIILPHVVLLSYWTAVCKVQMSLWTSGTNVESSNSFLTCFVNSISLEQTNFVKLLLTHWLFYER